MPPCTFQSIPSEIVRKHPAACRRLFSKPEGKSTSKWCDGVQGERRRLLRLAHVQLRNCDFALHDLCLPPDASFIESYPAPLFAPVMPILVQLVVDQRPARFHQLDNAVVVRILFVVVGRRTLPHL